MQAFMLVIVPVAADLWQKVLQVGNGVILSRFYLLFAYIYIFFFSPKTLLEESDGEIKQHQEAMVRNESVTAFKAL